MVEAKPAAATSFLLAAAYKAALRLRMAIFAQSELISNDIIQMRDPVDKCSDHLEVA